MLESSGFALRLLTERIVEAGVRIDELRVAGAQAQSALWNQTKADIVGRDVLVPAVTEVALMGSAIHAAVGAVLYADPLEAGEAMVRVEARMQPNPDTRAVFEALFEVYRAAYPALQPLFGPLGRARELAGKLLAQDNAEVP